MGLRKKIKIDKGFEEIRRVIAAEQSPFGRTTAQQKKERTLKAEVDLEFFGRTYLPHYLTAPSSKMHKKFYVQFREVIEAANDSGEGARIAKAAPRGNAKSTLSSLILPLWCLLFSKRLFIIIISDTTGQADEFLEFIKAELEINERLAEDFPQIVTEGPRWKVGQILTRNGIQLRCFGKGKRMRGIRHGSRRPDLVLCDDLEDDESVDSPEQRSKQEKWFFRALMKIGARDTVFIVIGTILHYDSLLAKLLNRPGWSGEKFKAVITWSVSPLWQEWEFIYTGDEKEADRFFAKFRDDMLKETEVLWPEVEDYYYLMKMRVSDGPAFFDSEKQNEPINPDDCLFQGSWIVIMEEAEERAAVKGDGYQYYAAVDPSMGKKSRKADPSAIVIAAVGKGGHIDIVEADIRKRHPDAIMEDLFNLFTVYPFIRLGIEEVQFQELFKDQVLKEGMKRGIYLPVEGVRPHIDKTLRISKLQPQIKNGVIRFRRNQTTLIDQLRYFPKADHDDGPDALEMVFSLIQAGVGGPRLRAVA